MDAPFKTREILPGLRQVEAPMGPRSVRWHVLVGEGGYSLVDTGLPGSVCRWLEAGMAPAGTLRRVLLTHADADHIGDAQAVQVRFPDAEFWAHPFDRPWMEDHERLVTERYDHARIRYGYGYGQDVLEALRAACGKDFHVTHEANEGVEWREGERLWRILHTPGHSPGHVCLWCEAEGILIAGDVVLGEGPPDAKGSPSMPPTHQFIADYLATISRLRSLPIELALTAHWPAMGGAAFHRFLDLSEAVVHRDLETVRAAQAAGVTEFGELLQALNVAHATWPESEFPHYSYALAGYLDYLEHKQ